MTESNRFSVMEYKRQFNLRFVREIEKRPSLYNLNLKSKTDKENAARAWEEMSQMFDLPAEECKLRWKSLRATFSRHYKETSDKDEEQYYLHDAMQFAIPYLKTFGPTGKMVPLTDKITFPAIAQPNIYNHYSTINEGEEGIYTIAEYIGEAEEVSHVETSIPSRYTPSNAQKRKEDPEPDENNFSKSTIEAKRRKKEEPEDPYKNKLFLLSLLSELNCLSVPKMRLFKRKVLCLIDDLREES